MDFAIPIGNGASIRLDLLLQNLLVLAIPVTLVWLYRLGARNEVWREAGLRIFRNRLAFASLVIFLAYMGVALTDSFSWRDPLQSTEGEILRDDRGRILYSARAETVLERMFRPLREADEGTYSAPLAIRAYNKEMIVSPDGSREWGYPRLPHAGIHLADPDDHATDLKRRFSLGTGTGLAAALLLCLGIGSWRNATRGNPRHPFRRHPLWFFLLTFGILTVPAGWIWAFCPEYHLLGTSEIGDDILLQAFRGIRTGMIIGGVTTLIAIPFAILFGTLAGYFGRWVDVTIQYIYSTLASIPAILLIIAFILLYGRGLWNLCFIMGITGWTGLCRLIRGETLKLREMDYAIAAQSLGAQTARVIGKHIVPNLMHLVVISFVLRFSTLVLAEAFLSYLNIGVAEGTGSWGAMVNAARQQLAREPVIWWNITAAFVFMLGLVLPANFLGDAVRDALDPRLRGEV